MSEVLVVQGIADGILLAGSRALLHTETYMIDLKRAPHIREVKIEYT
jgi:hypothetical protein